MKFQIRHINPNTERGWDSCFAVEKVLSAGENYLVATFVNVERAETCLNALADSLECATGATVSRDLA